MSLRKWMKLFGMTILLGALASAVIGLLLQLNDPEFNKVDAGGWLYNVMMMALSGLTFGAFAHMGFFAYLMLNYIARSIFRRPYLWVTLQGFVTLFVLIEIAYWTYGSEFPAATFWAVPLALAAFSVIVAWRKTQETVASAWVPALFFMIACTAIESLSAFRTGNIHALIFQMGPLFICNAYQLMQLHRVLGDRPVAGGAKQATV